MRKRMDALSQLEKHAPKEGVGHETADRILSDFRSMLDTETLLVDALKWEPQRAARHGNGRTKSEPPVPHGKSKVPTR